MKNRKTRKLLQTSLLKLLTVASFFSLPILTLAAPGDLDPTFGNGGIVITIVDPLPPNMFGALDYASGTAIQPDGKIVVVGGSYNLISRQERFAVVRYQPNGSLDSSFNGTGIVITPVNTHSGAKSVALQADGKIVVAGYSHNSSDFSLAVVRYQPNGSLDTSFNGTGIVITPFPTYDANIGLAIQADGKIVVVAGNSNNGSIIVRYNANGSLDTSFNGTGRIIAPFSAVSSVAIQTDGKIVVVGSSLNSSSNYDFTIFRYTADGSPDASFGGTGKVVISSGSPGGAFSVAIQPDGKIVSTGLMSGNSGIVRCNPDGSLDTTFGGTGIVIVGGISTSSLAIQPDGKIVAAGRLDDGDGHFAVVRRNPNGSPDSTFGNGTGRVFTIIGEYSRASSVAIQADGKIVVAGSTNDGFDFIYFAVVRYQGGSTANIRTRFDFDGDGRADVSVFRPSDRIWYLNQSTNGFFATQFGLSSDEITPADFDGDGKTDISVYRDGTWYWLSSSNNYSFKARQFGIASDIPVPADYTGDGGAELAVYRNGAWWIQNLTNNETQVVSFGLATDKPVVADYDGDGRADQAVYRNGEWHLNRSTHGYGVVYWGLATDKPVPADYDGDGKTDPAVYRDGTWYILQSLQGWAEFNWGISSDTPAPADYDGDGKADAAVFRDGAWWILQSANGVSIRQFGLSNDQPVPAAFLP